MQMYPSSFRRVLEVDFNTRAAFHFGLGRVRVVTKLSPLIDEEVLISVGHCEFSLWVVKETS